ncbi:NAD(P)H-dependent oxidoreductase [Reyranella aquatilis]|uniref:NAD(P)H-dependent oxidoreductase n=1 Tax=Reyranella aquatilis TaxID=2035356 RepID=A0ABS8KQV4_9HYPH|nr:NAD(P)H-dependent oxidoreductase [Reyranella aquatilis]MCC8428453.1 NAD(P)H-dependent oxidoreductase [Reyranella aquatilis]
MGSRILILNGHPDVTRKGLCGALADAYAEGGAAGGHTVERLDIGALHFDLLRSQADFETGTAPADIVAAQEAIRRADHLVVVFPLWLGDMPALLKGFFEQTLRPSFAFAYRPSGFPQKHLQGRSARLVVTMGMPEIVYRWYFRAHAVKNLKRNILGFVGYAPVRDTVVGSVGSAKPATMAQHFETMRALGRAAR